MLIYRPPRPDFWSTLTPGERDTVEQHFNWLAGLHEQGIVKFAGRSDDATFGIAIIVAPSEEEADKIMRASPAVVCGVYSGEVRAYHFASKP